MMKASYGLHENIEHTITKDYFTKFSTSYQWYVTGFWKINYFNLICQVWNCKWNWALYCVAITLCMLIYKHFKGFLVIQGTGWCYILMHCKVDWCYKLYYFNYKYLRCQMWQSGWFSEIWSHISWNNN